jgi:hypothetical protein
MRLRRSEHVRLYVEGLAVAAGNTRPRLQITVTGRRRWLW